MQVMDRIKAAMAATPAAHAATLFGERKAGSRWGREFTQADWDALLPRWWARTHLEPVKGWEGVYMPECTYFQAHLGALVDAPAVFPNAKLGAVSWDSLDDSEWKHVKEQAGPHGPELVFYLRGTEPTTHSHLLGTMPATDIATLILGPDEGKEVVYTIHPGLPLRPGIERSGMTAVKLIQEI
jgi:hypothetical protein